MAGPTQKKKRPLDALKQRSLGKPVKRQKHYHSDSEEEVAQDDQDFDAVNLLSDDDDILGAAVDDGASSGADSDDEPAQPKSKAAPKSKKQKPLRKTVSDAPAPSDSESNDDNDQDLDSDDDDASSDASSTHPSKPKSKSKRNDPTAFATSLQKILGTKLSTSRRADPVLARSADAHEASRRVADSALETKARKLLRDQKKVAQEKGRVKDVLVATNAPVTDSTTGELLEEGETTASIVEAEKRLRKVAQRGVVKLFNAVRAAQVNAAEAEREVRMQGVASTARRGEKVTEMSRKGFLDLIASGGGGLKKGPIEEA